MNIWIYNKESYTLLVYAQSCLFFMVPFLTFSFVFLFCIPARRLHHKRISRWIWKEILDSSITRVVQYLAVVVTSGFVLLTSTTRVLLSPVPIPHLVSPLPQTLFDPFYQYQSHYPFDFATFISLWYFYVFFFFLWQTQPPFWPALQSRVSGRLPNTRSMS